MFSKQEYILVILHQKWSDLFFQIVETDQQQMGILVRTPQVLVANSLQMEVVVAEDKKEVNKLLSQEHKNNIQHNRYSNFASAKREPPFCSFIV